MIPNTIVPIISTWMPIPSRRARASFSENIHRSSAAYPWTSSSSFGQPPSPWSSPRSRRTRLATRDRSGTSPSHLRPLVLARGLPLLLIGRRHPPLYSCRPRCAGRYRGRRPDPPCARGRHRRAVEPICRPGTDPPRRQRRAAGPSWASPASTLPSREHRGCRGAPRSRRARSARRANRLERAAPRSTR